MERSKRKSERAKLGLEPRTEQSVNSGQGLVYVKQYHIAGVPVQEYLEMNITKKHACHLADIFWRTDVNDKEDIAMTYDLLCDKFYRNPLKYKILDAFARYVNENSRKYRISIEKKGISTHLEIWTGWRHDYQGNVQYCTPLYGGYVLCCVFEEVRE